ncbi:hypothetical protein MMC13_004066 [Lambiella insularis]|nr:hypothetical protein [Lambiella insularis]
MPRHASIAYPTSSALSSSIRLPSKHPAVIRVLNRLSRPSLLALIEEWLEPQNGSTCAPYLAEKPVEEDSTYDVAQSLEELRETYAELQTRKGGKREVVDRVLEGDWRHGLSLRQLAMADIQHLLDHPTSQRWIALRLVSASPDSSTDDEKSALPVREQRSHLPRFHAPTFVRNLQQEIGELVKAHYNMTRMSSLPLTLLRINVFDFPYNGLAQASPKNRSLSSGSSTALYIAFPDNTPAIYVSFAASIGTAKSADIKSLRQEVIDALPKAFSRPQQRYTLEPTSLSARSLAALVSIRGPGSGHAAGGGWSIFSNGTVEESPLKPHTPVLTDDQRGLENKENVLLRGSQDWGKVSSDIFVERQPWKSDEPEPLKKKRRLIAEARFGDVGPENQNPCLERLDIRLEDPFPEMDSDSSNEEDTTRRAESHGPARRPRHSALTPIEEASESETLDDGDGSNRGWSPNVQLTFSGSDILSGIRKLVESGAIDGKKMPGWMTGETGVSVGVVRYGKIRGHKGSGL